MGRARRGSMQRGLIVDPTYRVRDDTPVIQLFGRLEDGAPFLIEDTRFRPYFFVEAGEHDALGSRSVLAVEETALSSLDGAPLLRVTTRKPGDVPELRERLERRGVRVFESDVRFPMRFLIDHDIRATLEIDGVAETGRSGLQVFRDPEIAPAECDAAPTLLSIDLETSPDAGRIFSAALVGDDADEVHVVASHEVEGAVVHADERSLLEAVNRRIRALDPDVLTGWNVVDFDLRVWEARCRALDLRCDIGRVPGGIRIHQEQGFARRARAAVPGRVVVDALPLVRDALKLPDYRLETVARERLGRGKLIDAEAPDKAREIERMYRDDTEALVRYNREDALLVLEILDREKLVALTLERSRLSGMPLDRVGASIASFDRLYLPALRRRGRVAPSVARERTHAGVRGGALLEPKPGYFRDVAVFDWKSLYPSLIRTFQLDPLAHAEGGDDAITAPNGARFRRDEAILPGIIERFMQGREAAKARGDRHADQAIKIMMNALFGVLGAPSCRFFDPEVANAITSFGQQTLAWTRDAFVEAGVEVIYGDTDSVFVALDAPEPDAVTAADALRERVQRAVDARVSREYGVDSRLVLEREKVFSRFFLPLVRGGSSGSKKRYAGITEQGLELVGLEAVRRDWPPIAGELQRGTLGRVFRDEDPLPFLTELVARVRSGACDDALVYVKRVRKGSLDRYTKATPPHVQAARKLAGPPGPVIRYVITQSGPEPVQLGHPLPPGIDHGHYVEKVLRPVAEAILAPLELSFDAATGDPQQLRLI